MSERKRPPILSRSSLTGRVYIVTRYSQRGDGLLVASEKYDVTEQFEALADVQVAQPQPPCEKVCEATGTHCIKCEEERQATEAASGRRVLTATTRKESPL